MEFFKVDAEKCKRTGFCVAECPRLLLSMPDKEMPPVMVDGGDQRCIKCGHCVAVCPQGAIELGSITPDACMPLDSKLALSEIHVEHFLRSRRSVRSYRDKAVERDDIERLIGIARFGPTGTNSQQVGWLVAATRDEVLDLCAHVADWMRGMIQAGHPKAELYNMPGIVKAFEGGIDIICRGAPALVMTHTPGDYTLGIVDSTIAMSYLDLAAPSLGLGTCWNGFIMGAVAQHAPLRAALRLPEGRKVTGAMVLGHPRFSYRLMPPRNAPEIMYLSRI